MSGACWDRPEVDGDDSDRAVAQVAPDWALARVPSLVAPGGLARSTVWGLPAPAPSSVAGPAFEASASETSLAEVAERAAVGVPQRVPARAALG